MALTLEEFLPKARQLNPDYTDDEHIQAYEQRYGRSKPVQTVSPAPLTTFEQFLPKARALNPDYSDEEHYAAWQEKYGARGAREKDQGDFVRGGVTAFKQIPQTIRGLEAGAGAIGEKIAGEGGLFTALKEHGLKGYQEHAADIAKDSKSSDSVTDAYKMAKAGDAGALVDWLQYALGYGGGQALQMLATAGVGYAGGKMALQPAARTLAEKMIAKESARLAATGMAGEQLAKQAVSNVAAKIGQTAALAGTAVGMEGGEIYGGLVEKAAQEGRSLTGGELAKAFGATLGAGALEFIGDKIGLALVLGKSLAGKLVSSRLGHAAAAGGLGTVTESGTEFTQTLLEEFGKGNDPFAPESIKQAVDSAAMGGVGGASMGTAGGLLSKPQGRGEEPVVTERTPEDMGLEQQTSQPPPGPLAIEGPPQPGELRKGTVYAPGEVRDASPTAVVDPSPVLNATDLDSAIAGALGIVQAPTEAAKARAAEFARMTAKAKNETDALLANAQPKRAGTAIPEIAGYEPPPPKIGTIENPPKAWMQEGMVELPTLAGPALTPRPEPIDDPRARLAEERARLVAQRDQQRLTPKNPVSEPVAPVPAVEQSDTPLPSQIDLAYPSSKQVRDLIHEKGLHLDTPVFREYLKMAVGKEKFSDLTPQELQTLAEKVQKIKAPQQPTPIQEAPPQVPLTPAVEKPYAPVTTIPEAQVPRSELTPEKNAEMLLRAEKAKADMEIAGTERGGRFFQEQQGTGSTQEVTGLKSATADWYKELTSGPSPAIRGDRKRSAREKIEVAIAKIIKDEGADRGKAVEQVKAALLQDTEFHKTEWGRDLNSIMQGQWPSYMDKPEGVTQPTGNAEEFQNVARGTSQVTVEEPKPKKVPLSRTERLAQQKQKMEGKSGRGNDPIDVLIAQYMGTGRVAVRYPRRKTISVDGREMAERDAVTKMKGVLANATQPEPSPSNAPAMESQPATASPERAPAPSTPEAAPKQEEPFSLTAPEVSKSKAKDAGPEQLGMDIPPETIGSRPIIGREATLAEAPLFSKNAQTPDAEQVALPEENRFADRGDGLNDAAKELRRLSHVTKKGDDVMLDNMEYVSFNEAVRIAREGIESGQVRPHPFQLNNLLGIAMGDAPRVLRAAQETPSEPIEKPEPTAKEPWEMTRDEYSTQREAAYLRKRGGSAPAKVASDVNMAADKRHERLVAEAVAQGKPVPPEVLADYPDLQQVAEKQERPLTLDEIKQEETRLSEAMKRRPGDVSAPRIYEARAIDYHNPDRSPWVVVNAYTDRKILTFPSQYLAREYAANLNRGNTAVPRPGISPGAGELTGRAKEDFTDYKPVLERQVSSVTGPNNKALAVVSVLTGIHPAAQQALVEHLKTFDPAAYAALQERNAKYPERAIGKTEFQASETQPEETPVNVDVYSMKNRQMIDELHSYGVTTTRTGGYVKNLPAYQLQSLLLQERRKQASKVEPIQPPEPQPEAPAQSPTEIIADALRTAADKIAGGAATESIDTVDKYQAFRKRLLDGEVTLDEYREAFRQVKDNKDALLAGLKKLNKDQLVKVSNSFHTRKSESKDSLIAQAYDGMLRGFALGRGVSYAITGKGSYENAMAKLVEQTTADDLAKFAEEVSKNTAEYKARVQGFLDPKTLEDFDARVRIKGEDSLTPEQLARYDELLAQAGREKRKQAQEQKATVQGVDAGTDLQLIESKHTKTGDKLWVVKLANRVDRAVYDRLNQAAHKLGGRYSSYNKDGAIPGFTFRSEEAAKSFMAAAKGETVSAAPIREEAKAQVQNNAVSKLREMADSLAEKADESLNADRKTNTAKRARQASHADNEAYANKALAETMRNLADAIESGEATHLSGLRTKAQVEMLDRMLESAKYERIKKETKGSYVDYERQKHRKAEPEDVAEATFPTFTLYKDDVNSALAELKDVKGAERLRMRLSKIMAGTPDGGKREVPREDAELALEKRRPSRHAPAPYWQWTEALAKLKRLESMGITSLPELRAALREYVEYRGKRGTIDKAKQLERELIGNKGIGNDFFPTPKETAQRMVAEAGIEPGMKVLEPSAGNGNIAEVIRDAGVKPDVVEQSPRLREILEAKGFNLVGQDFLDVKDGDYDRIVMNPPFSNGQDAEHIHHAYTLLKPGGKLVAIAGEGIFFRNDAKATAFRQWLDDVGGTSEKLPEGTFKDASLMATTGVNARMVTIEKPVEEDAKPDSFLSFLMDERGSIPASFFSRRKTQETGTIDPTEARDRLAAVKSSARPYLLGALGLEQLSQVYGKDHAEVKAYNKATQAMEADFTEMSRDSDKVARAWTDLKIPVADKMAQVMEDARFLNFDPDPKKSQEIDSEKKQKLRERFEQLPGDAQAVYRMARDFYANMAEQRFQALKERIERAGGTPENTRKLVDRLQLAYEKVRSKVYFPFSRFGENIVIAKQMKDGKEVDREVHAFESTVEAQKFATMMKLKGWQVKQTVAREYSVDKEGPASKIVRQMHDIIKELGQGQQGLPGVLNLEDQLLDSLNQSFLQALPDMSYAKHFIHAKDVKGASKDALRAFAHSALHGAHHISRIRHADQVTKALMDLDEKINATIEGDTTEARQVYNELVQRHNSIMNPNTHPVAAWLGQLGFTMSLGGVVATGITNATQVPLVTYPWMGARYGFGKASAALARAYRDFLDPRTLNKDSLFDATAGLEKEIERLSKMPAKQKVEALKDEVKMLKELAKRGHIDLTQTMDLAGLSSRDNLSRKARTLGTVGEKVTRMLGFTFHAPEVMNRQVTALSTFRLEKERGGSFEEALERAQQAIQDTHFIYQSHNRPRYMQGNFLRVLSMFKQYSQNIAYTYGRAASIWLDKNGATQEERTVAKRQLVSMLALQFGAAGALGMPFFGSAADLLMAVVGAFGDDDDKREWEVALRKWLDGTATSLAEAFIDDKEQAGKVGREIAEVVAHGASRLTPWDMATRLGQNDLFVREPQREREGRQAVMDWMLALGGPVPSYGVNFLLGMGDVAKGMTELNAGFFLRGVEELTPAVLRHGVKSLRYTLEGVRTRDEYKQLDLDTSEKLGQLFGFTPARVAEMYESITAVKNKEHRILNEQKALKDRFARAVDDQDDKAKQRILEDIRGFNERNPMFAITSNTLNRSIKTRRQHEAGMERGMYLPPRRRALLEEGEFGDF